MVRSLKVTGTVDAAVLEAPVLDAAVLVPYWYHNPTCKATAESVFGYVYKGLTVRV